MHEQLFKFETIPRITSNKANIIGHIWNIELKLLINNGILKREKMLIGVVRRHDIVRINFNSKCLSFWTMCVFIPNVNAFGKESTNIGKQTHEK